VNEIVNRSGYPVMLQPVQSPDRPLSLGQPVAQPKSLLQSILKGLFWGTIFAALLLVGLVFGGWWMLNNTMRDVLNTDTKTTVVTGAAVVESIKRVNKQIFIEHYNAVDIDYTEAPDGWLNILPIKQTFVVLLRGRVPAGFDLSQLSEKDVWISADHRRIQLTLPPPTIFAENVNVDFEHSRILTQNDTCPEFLCQGTIEAYKNQILPQGRNLLIEASLKSGIMEDAAVDGQRYYEQLLKSLGFEEVRVFIKGDYGVADD